MKASPIELAFGAKACLKVASYFQARRRKGKKGVMTVKVDLEKAYDRVSWEFLKQTLEFARLPSELTTLIMNCVQATSMEVLWNGERTNAFKPKRGLRQGDPLSPYLFVLCMERLSQLITEAVQDRRWKPVKASRKPPSISHLRVRPSYWIISRLLEWRFHSPGQNRSLQVNNGQ